MSVCPWHDDFDYVVALHIDLLPFQSSIVVRVSVAAMLWRLTLQRRRGKSPLAMESINDRYCRSLRGETP
jgi:hypothetical protein